MKVICLLCAAFTLSVSAGPMAIHQNETGGQDGRTPRPNYHSCPFKWLPYESRCFIYINTPLAWMDAEKHCWLYGANLASIHNQEEYDFIRGAVMMDSTYFGQAWIGGNDGVRTFDWFWSDGSEFVVQRWFTPAPVKIGRWWKCLKVNRSDHPIPNNWNCEDMLPFICGTRPG